MAHTPNRNWREEFESDERDRRQRERDYPSEFGNYPRRPDRWEEERGPRGFLDDPTRDRFGDPYDEDWQRPMRIPAQGGDSHAGRGPKNYQRSDERIHEDACERLTRAHDVDASQIEVSVKDGEITLEGTVPERRMKHGAEDCLESVSGARQVHNRLRVA